MTRFLNSFPFLYFFPLKFCFVWRQREGGWMRRDKINGIKICAVKDRKRKQKLSKTSSSDTPLPTRTHLFSLPNQHHHLGTKSSNAQDSRRWGIKLAWLHIVTRDLAFVPSNLSLYLYLPWCLLIMKLKFHSFLMIEALASSMCCISWEAIITLWSIPTYRLPLQLGRQEVWHNQCYQYQESIKNNRILSIIQSVTLPDWAFRMKKGVCVCVSARVCVSMCAHSYGFLHPSYITQIWWFIEILCLAVITYSQSH